MNHIGLYIRIIGHVKNHTGLLMCGVFSISTSTVFSCSWESAHVEGQLYVLIYAIVCKGLEHLHISMSLWVLKPKPEDTKGFGGVISYMQIFDCVWGRKGAGLGGLVPPIPCCQLIYSLIHSLVEWT